MNILYIALSLALPVFAYADKEPIELAAVPSVSPDGEEFVFVWRRDLWVASIDGGIARQLTHHPSEDHRPSWSPSGKEIAFSSKRNGFWNLYRMPAEGGDPIQLTDHSEGYLPLEWFPDGKSLLAQGIRDHGGFDHDRLMQIDAEGTTPDRLLFDAYAREGAISPDGRKVLFVREGKNLLYRKGYLGAKASQIWLYERSTKKFILVSQESTGTRTPMWKPDGSGFYYVGAKSGSFNIWEKNLKSGEDKQLTFFEDDSVILPRISRNGKTIVFRHQFDFYRFHPGSGKKPQKVELWCETDAERKVERRRWYDSAWNNEATQGLAWTDDFLEMAFSAGGDLWVMDTILREPNLICGSTASHETEVVFDKKNEWLFFLRDFGDHVGIWKARRGNADSFWFNNEEFILEPFTDDLSSKTLMKLSPDGTRLAYVRERGELVVTGIDKHEAVTLMVSDVRPWYEWSPDGKWMVVQAKDSNDNWDIWIVSTDGSREPYNLSRHPGWDGGPRWSPDGKKIVFVGRRGRDDEMDLFYVYSAPEYEEQSERATKLKEAERTLRIARAPAPDPKKKTPPSVAIKETEWAPPSYHLDFQELASRVKRVALPDSKETDPFWHSESMKLAFNSDIQGNRGTYYILFPRDFKPRMVTKSTGYLPIWRDNALHWMSDNLPGKLVGNTLTKYTFKTYQNTDKKQYLRLGFRIIWRNLRDYFYDENLNGKDWDSILNKYESHITADIDLAGYVRLVSMMHGELNASHLFFNVNDKHWPSWSSENGWRLETVHSGLRFEQERRGDGWKIRDVLKGGPCDHPDVKVRAGDVLLAVNGTKIRRNDRFTDVFNGRISQAIELTVKSKGKVNSFTILPISFSKTRDLLKMDWIKSNKDQVSLMSGGEIGYLHVDRMRWDDLEKFEGDVYAEGYGKKALIIDVRNNTGGFTADRMLYTLKRPLHAVTVPRGGHKSYPLGYLDYPIWDKPIAVLCNQNTSSNGEIFCHAIKTMKRGKLIGTKTSGSVISIYSNEKILDIGDMSVPFRGWYLFPNNQNLEGNGVVPDVLIWPEPGEIPMGNDRQLKSAVEILDGQKN